MDIEVKSEGELEPKPRKPRGRKPKLGTRVKDAAQQTVVLVKKVPKRAWYITAGIVVAIMVTGGLAYWFFKADATE